MSLQNLITAILVSIIYIVFQSNIQAAHNPEPPISSASEIEAPAKEKVMESYGKLPLAFIFNQGQMDSTVRFYTQGPGGVFYLTSEGSVSDIIQPMVHPKKKNPFSQKELPQNNKVKHLVLKKRFLNMNPDCEIVGEGELSGKINYLMDNKSQSQYKTIPTYRQVRYRNLYPGIDLIYYGKMGKLEYRYEIQPSTDTDNIQKSPASKIKFSLEGARKLKIQTHGNLIIYTSLGTISEKKPEASQDNNESISIGYRVSKKNIIGFKVDSYDHSKTLFIHSGGLR